MNPIPVEDVVEVSEKNPCKPQYPKLQVAPAVRGKGFSRPLIEKAIAFAKANGAKSVMAFPIPNDTRSNFPRDKAEFSGRHSTFKRAGFADREKLNTFYQVMELNLEGQ